MSCRTPVFSSCCFAQVTRVTSSTKWRSFLSRNNNGYQIARRHQRRIPYRPYPLLREERSIRQPLSTAESDHRLSDAVVFPLRFRRNRRIALRGTFHIRDVDIRLAPGHLICSQREQLSICQFHGIFMHKLHHCNRRTPLFPILPSIFIISNVFKVDRSSSDAQRISRALQFIHGEQQAAVP